MTSTYTSPMASNSENGHGRSFSHTRSAQRTRTGSRLVPPFPLPRIPSGRLDPPSNPVHSEESSDIEHGPFSSENKKAFNKDNPMSTPHPDPDLQHNNEPTGQQTTPSPYGSLDIKHAYSVPGYQPPRHQHKHNHSHSDISKPTKTMLRWTEEYPLLHQILQSKDSRSIFYFMLLNLAFMVVQSTYGFLTGSLGLISDSIHMFFDCIALLMGICASVMSKWPPSVKFPYGYGKIDTLAGFANGVFLMLISVEIVYEAVERLFGGSDVSRTAELLIVSSLGLLVNVIGILCFEHVHAHGHGHGGHSHDHGSHSHTRSTSPEKAKSSSHSHGSENMQGIYLHIMADALGSVAVVGSTVLVRYTGWSGWDPLASCIIAILIFASAMPLVWSSAATLLLSLDSDIEYNLRDTLAGVSGLRGVASYSVPKFWLDNGVKKEYPHHDLHNHSHSHHDNLRHSTLTHHLHENGDDHECGSQSGDPAILGVMHVIAAQDSDLDDVRRRTTQYLQNRNMDLLIQVEREGEGRCWCGGGLKTI